MPIPLLPAYQRGTHIDFSGRMLAWAEPLDTGPAYVRSREATRWHRPRSGHVHPDGRISYSYWCGASASHGMIGADEVGRDDPLCATCEGRFAAQGPGTWRFTAMTHLPPSSCPAARSEYWVPEDYRHGEFPCPVCAEPVKARGISPWYSGCAVTRHKPGPGLVAPCRYHGWFHLVRRDGRAVCRCEVAG